MTDARMDAELVRSERAFEVSGARLETLRMARSAPLPHRGRLTAERAAERRAAAEARGTLATAEAVELQPPPSVPSDPGASLRHARIGLALAAVLALLIVWIRQRRRAG